jgi:hypothetical protein
VSIDFDDPLEPQVLLPAIVPKRRPRFESFNLFRGQPHRLDLTMNHNWIDRSVVNFDGVDIQAKVFRRWDNPASLISHKTVANQGILLEQPCLGHFEVQLTKADLAETRPIYVAIYLEGALVDLFGNEVIDSPTPL